VDASSAPSAASRAATTPAAGALILGGIEDDPDDPLEALVFCPGCAAREFDGD
jgi:hypothetical protein